MNYAVVALKEAGKVPTWESSAARVQNVDYEQRVAAFAERVLGPSVRLTADAAATRAEAEVASFAVTMAPTASIAAGTYRDPARPDRRAGPRARAGTMRVGLAGESRTIYEELAPWGRSRLKEIGKRRGFDPHGWRELAGLGVLHGSRDGVGCEQIVAGLLATSIGGLPGPVLEAELAVASGSREAADRLRSGVLVTSVAPGPAGRTVVAGGALAELVVSQGDGRVLARGGLPPATTTVELDNGFLDREASDEADTTRGRRWLMASAIAAGLCRGALERTTRHARDREQFGRPLASFQAVQFKLAECAHLVESLDLMALDAARRADAQDGKSEVAAALAWRWAHRVSRAVEQHAHQVHGALGFSRELGSSAADVADVLVADVGRPRRLSRGRPRASGASRQRARLDGAGWVRRVSVQLEVRESAAVVTMDWPERRNALDPDRATDVASAIERAADLGVAALVLTGNGAFCSGGDLRYFAELATTATPEVVADQVYDRVQALTRALRESPLPTIAAVDGAAVGLGLDLALATDQRFAGPRAAFIQGWGALGLIHGTAGFAFLERERPGVAWRLLATQESVDRDAAVELGIAERGEPTAVEAAVERAGRLSALPRATREAYVSLAREVRWPSDDYFRRCAEVQSRLLVSDEFQTAAAGVLA